MAEDIILKIEVEDDELIAADKATNDLTDSLVELEQEQKKIKDSDKELNKELKKLNEEREQGILTAEEFSKKTKKVNTQLKLNNKDLASNKEEMSKTRRERTNNIKLLNTEQGTRARLRQKVAKLNKEYNNINTTTKEGQKRSKELADELSDLNEELNEGSKASGFFKDNIGRYGESLKETAPGLFGAAEGIGGMTKAALKFIATPLGFVLAAIVTGVKLFQGAIGRSADSTSKMNKIVAIFSGTWKFLLKQIEPVVDFILDEVLGAFDQLGTLLQKIGLFSEESTGELGEFIKKSQELVDAENRLLFAEKQLELQQLRSQKLAERQRQIRDDEALSIEERIEANKELARILNVQQAAELKLANDILETAKLRVDVDGATIDNQLAVLDAVIKIAEVEERIDAQRSEQLVNINSLRREENALLQERLDQLAQALETNDEITDDLDNQIAKELELADAIQEADDAQVGFVQTVEKGKLSLNDFLGLAKTGFNILSGLFQTNLDNRLQSLQSQKEAELSLVEGNAQETERINKDFLTRENELRKKQFNSNKLSTIAEIGIQTALNVIKAFLNPPLAIAAGIAGAFQIGIVASKKFEPATFAEGGSIVDGPGHTAGGVNVWGDNGQYFGNVEGDEGMFVMKKNATDALKLSEHNQKYGGRSFFERPTRINQEGGSLGAQESLTPQELANALKNINIVVGVKDILTGIEKRVQVIENALI